MSTHYFVISRRHICHGCKEEALAAKARAAAAATAAGLTVVAGGGGDEESQRDVPYTFMAYDEGSRPLLPYGHGDQFPALLSHRAALDKSAMDMMRPCFDKGLKPASFSNLLLELQTKLYTKEHLESENEVLRKRGTLFAPFGLQMFSSFGDKDLYCGAVPTGRYLSSAYCAYGDSIEKHLDREAKKRGCLRLHWDASYKSAKHMCR